MTLKDVDADVKWKTGATGTLCSFIFPKHYFDIMIQLSQNRHICYTSYTLHLLELINPFKLYSILQNAATASTLQTSLKMCGRVCAMVEIHGWMLM